MKQFDFAKNKKLKSRKKIQQLFVQGKYVQVGDIRMLFLENGENNSIQCSVGVSSRFFKKAVDRNRIKRILREAYRLQQQILYNNWQNSVKGISLFILYTGKQMPEYKGIYEKTGTALQKMVNIIHATNTENT